MIRQVRGSGRMVGDSEVGKILTSGGWDMAGPFRQWRTGAGCSRRNRPAHYLWVGIDIELWFKSRFPMLHCARGDRSNESPTLSDCLRYGH